MIPAGKLVVDTSVVVKWYLPEIGSEEAAKLLERVDPLIAPDLLVAEFGNVIWKRTVRGELTEGEAENIVDVFTSGRLVELRSATPFLRPAFDIAARWRCSVYDSLYLAVALAEGCDLVTADRVFGRRLYGTDLARFVHVVGDGE